MNGSCVTDAVLDICKVRYVIKSTMIHLYNDFSQNATFLADRRILKKQRRLLVWLIVPFLPIPQKLIY